MHNTITFLIALNYFNHNYHFNCTLTVINTQHYKQVQIITHIRPIALVGKDDE